MKFKLIPIKKIETKKSKVPVYDLTVKNDHSYVANNIVVHNSICSTRINTGFGVPLLSTIEECAEVKRQAVIIADGGIKYFGDIPKCIAVGADMAMLGRQFASTDLAPGLTYDKNKNLSNDNIVYKQYRGMASSEARKGVKKKSSIEGVSGLIPYTGTTKDFIENLELNLEASLSYCGAKNWTEFKANVEIVRISSGGWSESLTNVL